ncbi:MAG TPA: hypothetical protein VG844_12180 [Terracidiphilus sp.]|nr:hypothetical protein [Terracidiphilus sp.]
MTALLATILQDQPLQNATSPYMTNATIWHHMSDALNQSFYRVVTLLIAILPGLLAFFVALVLFTLIGMVVSAILRRALTWLRFDDRIAKMRGDANWTPSSTPIAIVARVSFWANVLLGLIIGVSAFDTSYATAAVLPISLLPYLTRSVGAILLLIAGNIVARFLARSVLIGAVNAQLQYARFLALGVKWMVLVLTAAMVLEHLEIGGAVVELAFGILFGGIVLTLALAVGLGSRDLVSRSLESRVERVGEHTAESAPSPAPHAESIQHF